MPRDHYVPQVHLRNFYSPVLDGKKMFGIRKADGLIFPCSSENVCRLDDGSTNPFIEPNRIVEEFLKTVEPRYNAAVNALRANNFGPDDIYVVAGYAAYVSTATPTAVRLGADPLKHIVETEVAILESQGALPEPPSELGDMSLSEMIKNGRVNVVIDAKYPQSIGITQILDRVGLWGNCNWDFILNNFADTPFFTSDTAFSIEKSSDPRIINRVFPLTPDFAVRIRPDFAAKKFRGDLDFTRLRYRRENPSRSEVVAINRAVVQCAETLIFSQHNRSWIRNFVKKNKNYWIAPTAQKIPVSESGVLNIFGIKIENRLVE
jgi:Protein of unknown function (DUF4238)